jgi:hypothetical protein
MKTKQTKKTLTIPTADGEFVEYDTELSNNALGRIQEVAFTNSSKAPELLATFNNAYLETARIVAMVQYEYNRAVRARENARAVFMVDKLPSVVASKGLATSKSPMGTEDIRSSLLRMDDDFLGAEVVVDELKAVTALFEANAKALEMAYTSVKKIISDTLASRTLMPSTNAASVMADLKDDNSMSSYFGEP